MNDSAINDSTLNDLMVLVERSVRPIRAGIAHKQKMRQELLAHVVAIFEDESARLGDDRLALQATRERFGDPDQLARHLQDSVPARERFAGSLERFFFGTGIPPWRLALRYALLALLPATFMLWAFFVQGRLVEWPLALAGIVLAFASAYLLQRVRQALFGTTGRTWGTAAPILLTAWLLIPAITFAVCLILSGEWRASLSNVPPLLPPALLAPVALIWSAYLITVSARPAARWENLAID